MSYFSTLPSFLQSLEFNGINAIFHRSIGAYLHVCAKHDGHYSGHGYRFDFIESIYDGCVSQWLESISVDEHTRNDIVLWALSALQNRLLRRDGNYELPYISNTHALAAFTLLMRSISIGAINDSVIPHEVRLLNEGLGLLKCFPGMATINDTVSRACFDADRIGFACYRISQVQVDVRASYRGEIVVNTSKGDFNMVLPDSERKLSVLLIDLPDIARKVHDHVMGAALKDQKFISALRSICIDITSTTRILEGVGVASNQALLDALNAYLVSVSDDRQVNLQQVFTDEDAMVLQRIQA